MQRAGVVLLLLFWAFAFAASVAVPWVIAPEGGGLTRGMNRLGWTVAFQVLALMLAAAAWSFSRDLPPADRLRRLSWLPVILAALFVMAALAPFVLGG
jgi:hypothetical protein